MKQVRPREIGPLPCNSARFAFCQSPSRDQRSRSDLMLQAGLQIADHCPCKEARLLLSGKRPACNAEARRPSTDHEKIPGFPGVLNLIQYCVPFHGMTLSFFQILSNLGRRSMGCMRPVWAGRSETNRSTLSKTNYYRVGRHWNQSMHLDGRKF
jgi:hypothetical protein